MNEPGNLTLVLVGSLADNDPWDLETWVRDDENAGGSTARWFRIRTDDYVERVSWDRLEGDARGTRRAVTVLGSAAPAFADQPATGRNPR
jgi:hypothetical protein